MRLAHASRAPAPARAGAARRRTCPPAGTRRLRPTGDGLSAQAEPSTRWTTADTIAGLLATASIFTSAVGLAYRPVRLIPFAILLAFVAARMSARQERLGRLAIAAAVICWTLGMTIAVITENPLY
jgi:hypothetical protein